MVNSSVDSRAAAAAGGVTETASAEGDGDEAAAAGFELIGSPVDRFGCGPSGEPEKVTAAAVAGFDDDTGRHRAYEQRFDGFSSVHWLDIPFFQLIDDVFACPHG